MIEVPSTHPVASERLAAMLDDARRRTVELTGDLSGERRLGPKLSIVNPPQWEIGHVGFFYDHFVLRELHGLPDYRIPHAERLYDSMGVAHDDRWDLPLPTMADTLDYLRQVRDEMVARLPEGTADAASSYAWQLAIFHEDMHGEAFAYTRQTLSDPPPALATPADLPEAAAGPLPGDVAVPGGEHLLGSDETVPFRFDNEKQPHTVSVAPFRIARAPVTNAEFAQFVADGGYRRRELWSEAGWAWREAEGLEAPCYWRRDGDGWQLRWFDRWLPLPPHQPVAHVSYYEAEAYCAWAGRRLPTEVEWEVAASRVPDGDRLAPGKRLYPWGDALPERPPANLDGYRLGAVDVAAFPEGESACGCRQMLGNVWEWTSSLFQPFPGFQADLYADYSEPWFKEGRRVLRGGAWATRSRLVNNNFRNFFTPERNDTIAGFRTCAL
ncbi:selenoneine synthase SenA [Sediminicurvatus halobius]|uniref:Ergothioneine biosynthesis protein EgtB n=1 Tax=Sediminicurvatus halobius TaxID=2182432 RepID=A0A2U2N6Y2_9GAMM|nr:selenoneine synthase SenA [Spiribacter halobius]PWG64833.1 ergothioneine biosynthesis protein EgtB [Spiribacter halobius]UEX78312.1 SUMF1/EgtB/PvdO family nonheme iron enzyme [Spiribacter halobius]